MSSQRDIFASESQQDNENLLGEDIEDGGGEEEDTGEELQANDFDPKTKTTKAFKDGELAILVDHMEDKLQLLTGFCRDHEYKRVRNNAWAQLVREINTWNEQNGTGIVRSLTSLRDKINNLKSRSKYEKLNYLIT